MSKEWKCTDCVKYKTDACSTCACGYTPTVSCSDVLVDFDYAYEQGKSDGITSVLDIIEHLDKQMLEMVKDILYQQDYDNQKSPLGYNPYQE